MKNYAFIPILTLVAAVAFSAETINEKANMKANGRLNVSNVAGSVEIKGWSRKTIEVTGELGDESRLIFEVEGNSARVEVEFDNEHRRRHHNLDDTDLVIHVPDSTRVSVSTVSADLIVEDIRGIQRLQTVSGDLETHIYDAEAVIKSVSGEIDVAGDGSQSELTVATVSGDVEVLNVAGEIAAKSVSGDVDIVATDFERLQMDTVSGDMNFSGTLETGGRIDAKSVSGDIELELDSLYNTEYWLESFSGDIAPVLGHESSKTSKYAPGSKLEMTEGDGDSHIRIETMSGDIDIIATGKTSRKPQVQQTSSLHGDGSDGDFDVAMTTQAKDMAQLARDVHKLVHDDQPAEPEIDIDD